jgi:hypothetical protein
MVSLTFEKRLDEKVRELLRLPGPLVKAARRCSPTKLETPAKRLVGFNGGLTS